MYPQTSQTKLENFESNFVNFETKKFTILHLSPRLCLTLQSVLLWHGKVSSRKRKNRPHIKLDCQKPWEISIVSLFGLLKEHSGRLYSSRGGVEEPICMDLWTLEYIRAVLQNVFNQTSCLFQKVHLPHFS